MERSRLEYPAEILLIVGLEDFNLGKGTDYQRMQGARSERNS